MAANKSPGAKDQAKKFLNDFLADGPMPKTEIEEAADANGISNRTLYRAKDDLHLIVEKERGRPNGKWVWRLPEQQPATNSRKSQKHAPLSLVHEAA
jgi:hypothetical protein